MLAPILEAVDAHRRAAAALSSLSDERFGHPSHLPGWTRAHVVAHLADNARAFARMGEAALRGELVDLYDGGQTERDALIDDLARLDPSDLLDRLDEHTVRLEDVWAHADAADWARRVRFRNGTLADTVFCRWREVWIHLVDCDAGVLPDEWPVTLAEHVVTFLRCRVPSEWDLEAVDVGLTWPGGGGPRHGVVRADLRPLAAWVAGRSVAGVSHLGQRAPELGPWPPPPAPLY